ncbi:uncharacterized protein LOC127841024 [Dreissena polymorpha]|uniref:uncharacterized protein LOC127841024 n=1 Tax=Dreissena polymorpha TaxID=45954 RepID=UPI0022650697|nr:uncharacterized protein LOC127841024 [Dreissena polymorpha]
MMYSATSFLLLVTFCGTVSCLWYPYRPVKPNQRPYSSSNGLVSCTYDYHCDFVPCKNPGEEVECHDDWRSPTGRSCHCHKPCECKVDIDCIDECGPFATCDDGACHGLYCDHT